jgi:hypothetical protein
MADDDDKYGRKDPPARDEWPHIFDGIQKSHKMWIIVGPIFAVVSNWKALVAIVIFVAWLNQSEIAAILATLTGIGP